MFINEHASISRLILWVRVWSIIKFEHNSGILFFHSPLPCWKCHPKSGLYPHICRYVIQPTTPLIPLIPLAGFYTTDIHVVSWDHPGPVYLHTGRLTMHRVLRITALIPSPDIGFSFYITIRSYLTFHHIRSNYELLLSDAMCLKLVLCGASALIWMNSGKKVTFSTMTFKM